MRIIELVPLSLLLACTSHPAVKPATPAGTASPVAVAPATPTPAASAVDAKPTERSAADREREAARTPLADALASAFVNTSPLFTSDGKHVAFQSNRDGSPQWYLAEVGKPTSTPVALTRGPERADAAELTRDSKAFIYLRDEGADENFAIYRVGLDGQGETNLTPGAKLHRDMPWEPMSRPGTLVYTQHDAKSPASELVVQALAGGAPKVVYTDPAPAFLIETSADGKRALLVRWISASDLAVVEVEVETGKARQVYPAEGKKVVVNDARYTPDGKRIYVAGDDGADGEYLYALDARTGKIVGQYRQNEPPTAFVSSVKVSPRGDRLAIGVNAGNHSEVRILDARSLALRAKVKVPLGTIDTTRFSADGRRFGLTVSTPEVPSEIFAVDTATAALTALRSDARRGLDQLAALTVSIETLKAFDGLALPLNVHLPAAKAGSKLPVVVQFHGGPSWSYQVRWSPTARFFTALGYAYVEPNVRGSTGFGRAFEMADDREKRADWLKDVATVNAWVKAQPWADPARVVVAGGSYGGYTVLMALTRQPTLWRAGVNLFGVANLTTFMQTTDQAIRAGFVQEFGDLDRDKALLDEFSPMRDVDKIVAPLFVYAGANDPRVPRSESDQIVRALRGRGVPVEYMVAGNEGHSLDRKENLVEYLTRAARFLDDNMR